MAHNVPKWILMCHVGFLWFRSHSQWSPLLRQCDPLLYQLSLMSLKGRLWYMAYYLANSLAGAVQLLLLYTCVCLCVRVDVCVGMYQNKVSAGEVCTPDAAHTYCRSNEIWHYGNIYQRWAFSYNAGAFWHNRCNKTAIVAEMFMRVSMRGGYVSCEKGLSRTCNI